MFLRTTARKILIGVLPVLFASAFLFLGAHNAEAVMCASPPSITVTVNGYGTYTNSDSQPHKVYNISVPEGTALTFSAQTIAGAFGYSETHKWPHGKSQGYTSPTGSVSTRSHTTDPLSSDSYISVLSVPSCTGDDGLVLQGSVVINITEIPILTGSCSASPTSVVTGQTVTWTGNAAGGTGTYTYSWSGASLSGTGKTKTASYSTTGTKTATVAITSGSQTISKSCSVTVNGAVVQPSCPFTATDGTIVNWGANSLGSTCGLQSDGPKTVSFAPGVYTVKTFSWDGSDLRSGQSQSNEQWYARFRNSAGTQITQAGPTSDLADYVSQASVTNTFTGVTLTETATQMLVVHQGNTSSCNSVVPICVAVKQTAVGADGECGSADGGTFTSAPTTNLCNVGTPSTVTGTGPWYWSCAGVSGGGTRNCTANKATSGGGPTCSPESQGITTGSSATLTASGGNGSYTWSGGGTPTTGSGSTFATQFSTAGTKTVMVTSDGISDSCTVTVSDAVQSSCIVNVTAPSTCGQLYVSSNIDTTWTLSGPQVFTQTTPAGTTQVTYNATSCGVYTISDIPTLPGYGLPTVVPSTKSGDLQQGNSVTFSINYPAGNVDLKANGSDAPSPVASGSSPALSWQSFGNVIDNTCTAVSSPVGTWSGSGKPKAGNETSEPINVQTTYQITCDSAAGSVTDSVTVSLAQSPTCSDGINNDGDGTLDGADSDECGSSCVVDCADGEDVDQCQDNTDNDGDGFIDWDGADNIDGNADDDPGCSGPDDDSEENSWQCSDGVDNADPEDELADEDDPGCYTGGVYDPHDDDESNPSNIVTQCNNGLDDDGDGLIDFEGAGVNPSDDGCESTLDPNEAADPDIREI